MLHGIHAPRKLAVRPMIKRTRAGVAIWNLWLAVLAAALLFAAGITRSENPAPVPEASPIASAAKSSETPGQSSGQQDAEPAYSAEPKTHGNRIGLFAAAASVALLNLGTWIAFWYYLLRPLQARLSINQGKLDRLRKDHDRLLSEFVKAQAGFGEVPGLWRALAELQSSVNQLHRLQSVASSASLDPTPDSNSITAKHSPVEVAQELSMQVSSSREQLGAEFIREIKLSGGMDSAAVWERYFAKIKVASPNASDCQLYWDRADLCLKFQERAPNTFKDTGTCWLFQTGGMCLLFFPALAGRARKNDLPGCRIVSSGAAVLSSTKLEKFTPPVVERASDGWIIQMDGSVEYQ
jgi:hypothetical protein